MTRYPPSKVGGYTRDERPLLVLVLVRAVTGTLEIWTPLQATPSGSCPSPASAEVCGRKSDASRVHLLPPGSPATPTNHRDAVSGPCRAFSKQGAVKSTTLGNPGTKKRSPAKLVETRVLGVGRDGFQPRQHPNHVPVYQRLTLPERNRRYSSWRSRDARKSTNSKSDGIPVARQPGRLMLSPCAQMVN